jgi:hypothetical protein
MILESVFFAALGMYSMDNEALLNNKIFGGIIIIMLFLWLGMTIILVTYLMLCKPKKKKMLLLENQGNTYESGLVLLPKNKAVKYKEKIKIVNSKLKENKIQV